VITPSRTDPTPLQINQWRARRRTLRDTVEALSRAGICYQCHDLQTGGEVFGQQCVIADHPDVRAVLALDPRAVGHTIVVWKRHVQDFTELNDAETARLFTFSRDIARAIQSAIEGVERVYQVTMCDGRINHLHVQLLPRFAGTDIGSARLVAPRQPLVDGDRVAEAIHSAYTMTTA
jgi:diadenosine tetraphosphate (Ap4A) HIT family hydrolase